jgi:alpha-1,3-rhamnosyltransferase
MNNNFKNNMLVSVVVVTYNSARFVEETLESVKNQTYQHIELIVSDDCSKDNTLEICRNWLDKNKERFVNTQIVTTPVNTGIPANKNRAVKAATGEWLKNIAGDDTLIEDCIEKYMNYLTLHPEILVLHSNFYEYKNQFSPENKLPYKSTSKRKLNQPHISAEEQFQILLRVGGIRAGSVIMNRKVFDMVGYYDESMRLWEDVPMWLKLTKAGIKLHYIDIVVQNYRRHSDSVVKFRTKNRNDIYITDFKIYVLREYNKRYKKYLSTKDFILKSIADNLLLLAYKYTKSNYQMPFLNVIMRKVNNLSVKVKRFYQKPYR